MYVPLQVYGISMPIYVRRMYENTCLYTCVYEYNIMRVCVCVCMCIYIYTHTHTRTYLRMLLAMSMAMLQNPKRENVGKVEPSPPHELGYLTFPAADVTLITVRTHVVLKVVIPN